MALQLFSSTVRPFRIYNASKTSILSIHKTAYSSQFQRERLPTNIRKSVEKIMGPRPKQPLPPYFRFTQLIRPQIVAEHPHLQQKELHKIFCERWKSLETKEKAIFSVEYRNDMLKYSEDMSNYNSEMSAYDKRRVEEDIEKNVDRKRIKVYQRLARESNKPKKPPSSFLRFLHAQTDRRSDETHKDFVKRTSCRWNSLSETERKEYETKPKEKAKYKKAMLAWETSVQRSVLVGDDRLHLLKFSHDDDQYDQETEGDDEHL